MIIPLQPRSIMNYQPQITVLIDSPGRVLALPPAKGGFQPNGPPNERHLWNLTEYNNLVKKPDRQSGLPDDVNAAALNKSGFLTCPGARTFLISRLSDLCTYNRDVYAQAGASSWS